MAADKSSPVSQPGEQPEQADLVALEAQQVASQAAESLRAMVGNDVCPISAISREGVNQFIKEQLTRKQDSLVFKNADNAEQAVLQDKAKQGKASVEEMARLAALRTFPDNKRGQELVIKEYLDNRQTFS